MGLPELSNFGCLPGRAGGSPFVLAQIIYQGKIRLVDEFPMTVTGKAQKFVMRERMTAELGAAPAKTA